MKLSDRYDGSAGAFEGDKTLLLRSLPAGARVTRATLSVTPVAGPNGALFEERIDFADPSDATRTFGATKIPANGASAAFVEVDFHKRRTLAAVTPAASGSNLLVDLGGVYVQIDDAGGILSPTDPTPFTITDGTLPGLTVSKFKLTGGTPQVSTVTIRSTPSNLTVRLGKMAPFWARPGELAAADTSPDFAALLQAFLATAPVENGYYLVPLVVHSDTLARLSLSLDVVYLNSDVATPNGLGETALSFDVGTLANAPQQLAVELPSDARVVAGATTARVFGQFAATRIVEGYGAPTGVVAIAGGATVTPQLSLAQIVAVDAPISASAIDLSLTGVTRTAQLALDLRADLDGKPDGTSLLGGPVAFPLQSDASPTPAWVSVALPTEFHFASAAPTRYWIVLQSIDGNVTWNLAAPAVPATSASKPMPGMQQTTDGGLSWRATPLAVTAGAALTGLFRFRYLPAQYQVPIEVQVGSGDRARLVKLDRYQPLNRVDFAIDIPELADAFNQYLASGPPAVCSHGEHIANGDFRQWIGLGGDLGAANVFSGTNATGALALSPDGRHAYVGVDDTGAFQLAVVDVQRDVLAGPPIPLQVAPLFAATSVDGGHIYVGTTRALYIVDVASRTALGAVTFIGGAIDTGAVSPDGTFLYVGTASGVQALSTNALDAINGTEPASILASSDALPASPSGIAPSPDGTMLYVAAGPSLLGFAAPSLTITSTLQFGSNLAALAVTPDGKSVVVLDTASPPNVHVVDASSLTLVRSLSIPSGAPQALTISPDGARAYVLTSDSGAQSIAILDLARLAFTGQPTRLTVTAAPVMAATNTPAVAPSIGVTASGNRLYVCDATSGLTSVPVGTSTPSEWSADGDVRLAPTAADPPAVVIGDEGASPTNDASLSQVVPAGGGCSYVFAFSAIARGPVNHESRKGATESPVAQAELNWLSAACGLVRTDTLAIATARASMLTPNRAALQAPPSATQVEVRFHAAAGTVILLSSVSLAGNADAIANGDLQQTGSDGLPAEWSMASAVARRTVALTRSSSGAIRVSNLGSQDVELVQNVGITANDPLHGELVGRAEATTAAPSMVVDFTASDGSPIGTATSIGIDPADFERHSADLLAPVGSSRANVRLRLPASTAIEVRALSLQPVTKKPVPVSFIAQAPGDLRVSQAVVAYERIAPSPPPVPAGGLCTPTPADQAAAERSGSGDECYCTCCKEKRTMQGPTTAKTPAGRPVTVGTCATCGTTMLRGGGTVALGTSVVAPTEVLQPSLVVADSANRPAISVVAPRPAPTPLTAVRGIGAAHAVTLATVGITTIEQLASANAKDVAQALRGVTPAKARGIVREAQRLVHKR